MRCLVSRVSLDLMQLFTVTVSVCHLALMVCLCAVSDGVRVCCVVQMWRRRLLKTTRYQRRVSTLRPRQHQVLLLRLMSVLTVVLSSVCWVSCSSMPLSTPLPRRPLPASRTVQHCCRLPFCPHRQPSYQASSRQLPCHRRAASVVRRLRMSTDCSATWCAMPVRQPNCDVSVVQTAARRSSSSITSKNTHASIPVRNRLYAAYVASGSVTRARTAVTRHPRSVGQAEQVSPVTTHRPRRQTAVGQRRHRWLYRRRRPLAFQALPQRPRRPCRRCYRSTLAHWLAWRQPELCRSFQLQHLSVSSRPQWVPALKWHRCCHRRQQHVSVHVTLARGTRVRQSMKTRTQNVVRRRAHRTQQVTLLHHLHQWVDLSHSSSSSRCDSTLLTARQV